MIVYGYVQGVFFRDSTRRRAEAAGVSGSVGNRPDGTVEAVFEGPREGVEAMVAFCRRGPARAEVARIELFEEQPEGLQGFQIA